MGILVKSSIDSRQFVLDYQTFLNKNNSNKTHYNSLVKSGQLKPEQYTSITIERIDTYGVNVSAFVNLYSKVFSEKPKVKQLTDNDNNLSYIEEILEEQDIKDYDIVIAWGNTLVSHTIQSMQRWIYLP